MNAFNCSEVTMAATRAGVICGFLVVALVALVGAGTKAGLGLKDLVPDPLNQEPLSLLEVRYGTGKRLCPGQELKPAQVRSPPTLAWPSRSPGDLFTVIMSDLDAPSRTNRSWSEVLHWMVVNAPAGAPEAGDTIAEYLGSGPPLDSGKHRYAFLVFRQPGRLDLPDEPRRNATSIAGRPQFKTQQWAEDHSLEFPAFAGNYFQAEWDESVPELHKQLSL